MTENTVSNPLDEELYPALYEVSEIYDSLAWETLESPLMEEFPERELIAKLGLKLMEVAKAAEQRIEPRSLRIQGSIKRIYPKKWKKDVDRILYPAVYEAYAKKFWEGVDVDEPAPRHRRNAEWLADTIQYFKNRPLNTTVFAKVLFSNQVDNVPINHLQTRVSGVLRGSRTVPYLLRERRIELEEIYWRGSEEIFRSGSYVYVGKEIGSDVEIDYGDLPTDEELRELAIELRIKELQNYPPTQAPKEQKTPEVKEPVISTLELPRRQTPKPQRKRSEYHFQPSGPALDEDGFPLGFIEHIEELSERLKNPPSHSEIAKYMKTRGWEREEYLTES